MTLTAILAAWLAVNYAIMARLTYVALRKERASWRQAARGALAWPATLLRPGLRPEVS